MSAPYVLRRFRPEDHFAVANLAVFASSSPETACGQPDVASIDEFQVDYGHRNLEAEAWVAETPDGRVVGFAAGTPRGKTYNVDGPIVAPEFQGLGIGSGLFACLAEDAQAQGVEQLEGGVRATNDRGHRFLASQGFEPSRQIYVWESHKPLEATYEVTEGYTLGELKPKYLLPFLMVMHECFPDYRLPSNPQRLFEPDKMKIFLALGADDKPVGAVTAFYYPEDRMGYIYHLGVSEPHRGNGLARALLLSAVDWLWTSHEPTFVGLSTSAGGPGRRTLYEQVGFELQYSLFFMRKLIASPAEV
jgi:GNAT superfamily N-acetyltransferase